MHKETKGHLEIRLSREGNFLGCRITDEGIGRKKTEELKSKSGSAHKSTGMQITASRIEGMQKNKQPEKYIKINDPVLLTETAGVPK